jgi:hypothetical protein
MNVAAEKLVQGHGAALLPRGASFCRSEYFGCAGPSG